MVIRFGRHIIFVVVFISTLCSFSQGHLSSSVTFNKNNVYIGEPVQVKVSVFTSTWFTKGVNPGNIKVNGAFTVYFRSLSTSKQVNGKTHAGVQLFFNVFPYEDKPIEFPSLEIEVETPDLGGYKGIQHIIKTNPRTIKVKPIPSNFDADNWLVTSWMPVTENWNGDLKNVKVGDVLERSVFRNASNTVSELIPPVQWEPIANVSLYPTRSSVRNNKSKTAISATRSEGVRYLFEKEGEVVIPKMELTWYNPYKKKLYKKTLPEVVINVQPNPDLGMLTSIKKQLEKDKVIEENDEETALNIFGLSIKQFLLYLFIGILLIYLLVKIIRLSLNMYQRKRAAYLRSEKYYFDQFFNTISTKSSKQILPKLYRWIDALNLKEPTIESLMNQYGTQELKLEIIQIHKNNQEIHLTKKLWKTARKNYLSKNNTHSPKENHDWINPL